MFAVARIILGPFSFNVNIITVATSGLQTKSELLYQVTVGIVESIRVILTFVCGVANANVIVTIVLTFNFKSD